MVCGETEVAAANLRITINNLEKMTEDGTTGFQKQLKVSVKHECYNPGNQFHCCILNTAIVYIIMYQILDEVCSQQPVSCADAEKEYNSSKNRFPDKLPSENILHHV